MGWKGSKLPTSRQQIILLSASDSPPLALGQVTAAFDMPLQRMRFSEATAYSCAAAMAVWAAPLDQADVDLLQEIVTACGTCPLIVETPPALLDSVWHELADRTRARILVAPEPIDVAAVLLAVLPSDRQVVRDSQPTEAQMLIDEIRAGLERYTQLLAQLTHGADTVLTTPMQPALPGMEASRRDWRGPEQSNESPAVTAQRIRTRLRQRRLRTEVFGDALFSDPSWEMLLDLYASTLEGRRVSISSLCIAADVPHATAWRRLSALIDRGILTRTDDPDDRRRSFVSFTETGRVRIETYFSRSDAIERTAWESRYRESG